jgi:DNA-binding beta-propeller fold protein YncE
MFSNYRNQPIGSRCGLPAWIMVMGLVLLLLPAAGCRPEIAAPGPRLLAEIERGPAETARLSLFLNLSRGDHPAVKLEISSLAVLGEDGWVPLAAGPLELDSARINASQLFLGGRALQPGRYQRLRFTAERLALRGEQGRYETLTPDPFPVELELPAALDLDRHDSRSLFITWDVQATLEQDGFLPAMIIAPQITQLLSDLVYVACPDIDTIFVIRSDRNWVADSFGLSGRPTHLELAPGTAGDRLFVLAAGEKAIKMVDLPSQRVVDVFHLPLTEAPTFMTISPDGRWAYVLEERSDHLSRIDLTTGRSAARVRVGYRPQTAAYLADRQLLAVSSALSQTVSLLRPLELTVIRTIPTGNAPQGLLARGNQLYIAENGDHAVLIFDLSAGRDQTRLDVGLGPRRLLDAGDYIYAGNYQDGSISVLLPGLPGVVAEIRGLGRPLEMAYDRPRRLVYVGEEQNAGLAVIDAVTNRLVGRITLGARPAGLAAIQ